MADDGEFLDVPTGKLIKEGGADIFEGVGGDEWRGSITGEVRYDGEGFIGKPFADHSDHCARGGSSVKDQQGVACS